MEVRDDEVRVGLLVSDGTIECVTPDSPPIVNIAMNPSANSIGVVNRMAPPHIVPSQLKIFTPVGTAMSIVERPNAEFATGPSPMANMWCAHTPQPDEPDRDAGEHDERVAEQRLAREHRQDLGDDAHAGQDQDVHLGMAEQPEQVLLQQRVAAGRRR